MSKAFYPGSFDPVTYGHLDIIKRASHLFGTLVVGVLNNNEKRPLFSVEERVKMLELVCADVPNVSFISYSGLLADYTRDNGIDVIIRGLRAVTDFEYELQIAQTNRKLNPGVDTIFLTTSLEYAYLSSSIVREVAFYGGDVSNFVPDLVSERIRNKFNSGGEADENKD